MQFSNDAKHEFDEFIGAAVKGMDGKAVYHAARCFRFLRQDNGPKITNTTIAENMVEKIHEELPLKIKSQEKCRCADCSSEVVACTMRSFFKVIAEHDVEVTDIISNAPVILYSKLFSRDSSTDTKFPTPRAA